jgi:aminoglycoside phosphotransferase (APT) family kinase protein
VDRTPAFLAALASAAVTGLDPVSVEALPSTPEQDFDVAFVQDTEHRRWVVRAPRSDAAGAQMETTVALLGLLARRLPFAVPSPKGFVGLAVGGRAMVYPYLPGHNLDLAELPPGPGLAAELGRAIAAVHNTDPEVFEEAGLPAYEADAYRTRRLADLDRAAGTGMVPSALLTRWERALEDVALWRFGATPVHGDLTGDQVLAVFDDDTDASTGRIRGLTGWEDAKVADPADDFAALVADATPEALETVLEGYAHARVERPDPNLVVRARLASELAVLGRLLAAVARDRAGEVDVLTTQLRRLDERVHAQAEAANDYRRTSLEPVPTAVRRPPTPPPAVIEEEGDDEELPAPAAPPAAAGAERGEDTTEVALADRAAHASGEEARDGVEHGLADDVHDGGLPGTGETDPDGEQPGPREPGDAGQRGEDVRSTRGAERTAG